MTRIIRHYGVKGMKWGIRRYQNSDGSLTARGRARLDKKDDKWAAKQGKAIQARAQTAIKSDLAKFVENELDIRLKTNGKITAKTILDYNNKMAQLMNNYIGDIALPSGRVLRFVAKRGSDGVYMAYATAGYDMSRVKQGVFQTGKVGYRDENLMQRGG